MSDAAATLAQAAPAAVDPAATALTTPPQAPAANNDAWYSKIANENVRNWTEAKGFKDPLAVAESAYNLEKLLGHDRAGNTLVLPKDNAAPEEVRGFWGKLGVPEKPEGYILPVPEGQSDALAKTAAAWFHEANIPAKAAEAFIGKWNEFQAAQTEAANQAASVQTQQDLADLKTEWGQAYSAREELARRAVNQFIPGENKQEVLAKIESAIGTKALMNLFAKIGEGLGEHKMVTAEGSDGFGVMTPGQAKAKIEQLRSNAEWSKAYLAGDKQKQAEMQQLHQFAYPELQ